MEHKEKLNQEQLDNLQMERIDLSQTDWFGQFNDDVLLIHNPRFRGNWEPYILKYVLLVLCNDGNGYGAINLHPIHLQKDSLMIALPSQIVESNNSDEYFKGSFLLLSERFMSRINLGDVYMLYRSIERSPVYQLDEGSASLLRSLIDLTGKLIRNNDGSQGTEEIFSLITRLFYLLICRVVSPYSEENEPGQRQGEVMMRFLQLLKHYFREHREVGFYADKMNLTPKYMTTLVKKASGKSAIQWIEDYVILEAKAQLSSTVNTIQQIAFDLNFPSQSIFGRYFKRAVGISPSDYRASMRIFEK